MTKADKSVLDVDVVEGPASAVTDRIVTFNGTSGKLIKDSGILISAIGNVVGAASSITNTLAVFADTTGKLLKATGVAVYAGLLSLTGGLIVSGTISGVVGSTASSLEVQGATDAGTTLYRTGTANTTDEVFWAAFAKDAGSNLRKTFSLSEHWHDTSATDGFSVSRINTTYRVAGTGFDDLQIRMFGGHGMTMFGTTDTDIPTAVGDGLSKLLLRAQAAFYRDVSGLATSLGARNLNAGATAKCRIRMGNNASENGFTIDLNSSAHTDSNAVHIVNQFNAPIYVGTDGTEKRYTFGASGNFSVNKVNASTSEVKTGVAASTDGYIISAIAGTGNDTHIYFTRNAAVTPAVVGSISSNAGVTTYATSSDANLKFDDGEITFEQARTILDLITFHNFHWKLDNSSDMGVFAQELYEIYPRAVVVGHGIMGDDDFVPWMVDYSKLIPIMGKCLQGVMSRIDLIENKLTGN